MTRREFDEIKVTVKNVTKNPPPPVSVSVIKMLIWSYLADFFVPSEFRKYQPIIDDSVEGVISFELDITAVAEPVLNEYRKAKLIESFTWFVQTADVSCMEIISGIFTARITHVRYTIPITPIASESTFSAVINGREYTVSTKDALALSSLNVVPEKWIKVPKQHKW